MKRDDLKVGMEVAVANSKYHDAKRARVASLDGFVYATIEGKRRIILRSEWRELTRAESWRNPPQGLIKIEYLHDDGVVAHESLVASRDIRSTWEIEAERQKDLREAKRERVARIRQIKEWLTELGFDVSPDYRPADPLQVRVWNERGVEFSYEQLQDLAERFRLLDNAATGRR